MLYYQLVFRLLRVGTNPPALPPDSPLLPFALTWSSVSQNASSPGSSSWARICAGGADAAVVAEEFFMLFSRFSLSFSIFECWIQVQKEKKS
jgi:hypothetical protein